MKIIKRSGIEVDFDINRIRNAIKKANDEVIDSERLSDYHIDIISDHIKSYAENCGRCLNVEEIQDAVEEEIMRCHKFRVAKKYITYRYRRALVRKSNSTDEQILSLIKCDNEEIKQENSNKNPYINSTQRDYIAGEVSKDITKRMLLDDDIWYAHENGLIHFHDSDYFIQPMNNCCLINLEDMLQNGTVISDTMIEKPKSFSTACNIATQVIAQVASAQYGGQSITLSHLAPFVDISRKKIRNIVIKELKSIGVEPDDERVNTITESRVKEEINRGIQMIQYQLVTLMTTNGQTPFITVFMYINEVPEGQTRDDLVLVIEETLKQRLLGVKNKDGVYITPAFPKLIYVLQENNIEENSKYWYVTELAAKCTAKRMVPDYISEKKIKELKKGDCYPCMGCRSFLTPDRTTSNLGKAKNYVEGKTKYYGRFNQGVVTLNLVDIACSSEGRLDKFWKILDDRLNLCYRALMARHKRLEGTLSDTAPILWQNGALARFEKGETIDPLLHGGYSTISLGYAGICECTKYMMGVSHTDPKGTKFALEVMKRMNDACNKWKEEEDVDFSIYGTPLESTTYKFAKCLQNRFGIIPGVTDKNYITNSYHVHVTEEINAFEKLEFESQFQELSPGGAISYVEVPNLQNNIPAVLTIMKFIYDHIIYAEINTKSDYCQECGFDGEIIIVNDKETDKLIWECPNCGNRNQRKMNVARRTCGLT